jgi:hypothetical protein
MKVFFFGRYLIAGLLLWKLNKRFVLLPKRWKDLSFNHFLIPSNSMIMIINGVIIVLFSAQQKITSFHSILSACSYTIL